MQTEIVHGANTHDAHPGESLPDAVHERATRRAKVVGHLVSRGDGLRLSERLEVLAAAQILQVRVGDREVGREHGCREFATVSAITDECVDEARALGWLWEMLD